MINAAGVIDFELKPDLDGLSRGDSRTRRSNRSARFSIAGWCTRRSTSRCVAEKRAARATSDAYRAALLQRTAARDLVVAFLDANKLDAIVYPTVRRKAAFIGEPQRGANCQLSAVTGLPALTVPAGFTPDGMPIGVELLGRPLDDARLVAMAYDYEQATHPRRAPSTTPPLVDGKAPKPATFAVVAGDKSASARGEFSYDPTRRALAYSVRVTGVPASHVFTLSIDRDSAGRKGPMMRHLAGAGTTTAKGTLTLTDVERRDLVAGRFGARRLHERAAYRGDAGVAPRSSEWRRASQALTTKLQNTRTTVVNAETQRRRAAEKTRRASRSTQSWCCDGRIFFHLLFGCLRDLCDNSAFRVRPVVHADLASRAQTNDDDPISFVG